MKQIQKDIYEVIETPAGLRLFQHFMDALGYKKVSMQLKSDGEVAMYSSVFNESRREFWLELQKVIAPEHLRLIENPVTKEERNYGPADNDDADTRSSSDDATIRPSDHTPTARSAKRAEFFRQSKASVPGDTITEL